MRGALKAQWKDVVVPEKLAGRVLASRGAIDTQRHAEGVCGRRASSTSGRPNELVHVLLDASTAPTRASDFRQLELRQRAGQFALSGHRGIQAAWPGRCTRRRSDFNPGELLAEWPGTLNIDAQHARRARGGRAAAASLQIASLSGELRGRPIAGDGDIEFAAPSTLAGDLRVSSGKSRIAVKGSSADRSQIDATVELADRFARRLGAGHAG